MCKLTLLDFVHTFWPRFRAASNFSWAQLRQWAYRRTVTVLSAQNIPRKTHMSLQSVIDQFGNNVRKPTRQNHFLPSYTPNASEAAVQGESCLDCLHNGWELPRPKEFSECKSSSFMADPSKKRSLWWEATKIEFNLWILGNVSTDSSLG